MNKRPERRQFLKMGAALPLALNSARIRAAERPLAPPQRIIFICNSLGFYRRYFFPKRRGDLASSDYLKELRSREKLTVLENLFHPGMETSNHDSEKSFLTGAPKPEASGFVNTISLDQLIARKVGSETRFPFLSFSIYDRGWGCSWNDRGSAIPPMHDVELIFNRMFGPEDLKAKRKQIANDQRILESLRRDLNQLIQQRTTETRLQQYRSLVTELENHLTHEKFWLDTKKPSVEKSLSQDKRFEFSTKVRNLFELAKLAFRTDSTRVITLSLDWIYGAIQVPGATGGWHTLSHHGERRETLKSLSHIEADIIRNFDRFLSDLDQIREGNGTLLDHTTVVFGSNFGDASNHTCHQLPILVAGGGFPHQQHKVLKNPTPLCNLWLEILHRQNIDVGKFGNGQRDLNLLG